MKMANDVIFRYLVREASKKWANIATAIWKNPNCNFATIIMFRCLLEQSGFTLVVSTE